MEILPCMRSEKLYFKPIIYPEKWDQYKESYQMYIANCYLLHIANAGTDDPKQLFNLIGALFKSVDWDSYCDETDQYYVDKSFDIIQCLMYARVLELGVWDAHFVTLGFVGIFKSSLEPLADLLLYNENPVPVQMLVIAALYIDLLWSIKNSEGKDSLEYFPNSKDICHKYPQMVSNIVTEIKSEPLPITNYVSWVFEKASHNLEAQKQWPFLLAP